MSIHILYTLAFYYISNDFYLAAAITIENLGTAYVESIFVG